MAFIDNHLRVAWEDWPESTDRFSGPGLTVFIAYDDYRPPPTVRLTPESARALRDYLNGLALD